MANNMDDPEQWITGFEVPLTLQEAEDAWYRLKTEETEILNELQDYRNSRQNTITELEEMQRRYTARLGNSNVTQKLNQNLAKLFHESKKLTKLTSANLNKFYLWKEEIEGMATIANMIHEGCDHQVYNTWIWNSIDEPLRGLCMNMDPVLHHRKYVANYLKDLELTLKPDGFNGLARFIFETQKQRDKEPVNTFWERCYVHYNEAKLKDEHLFKETFLQGLANHDVMLRVVDKHPDTPAEVRTMAVRAVQEVLDTRRLSKLSMNDEKAMAGLYTEALSVSHNLAAYVGRKTPKCSPFEVPEPMEVDSLEFIAFMWEEVELNLAEPLWGEKDGDEEIQESEDQYHFWEDFEQISEVNEGGKNACWSCGEPGHQRRFCPLRRKGQHGRNLALNLQKYDPERKGKPEEEGRRYSGHKPSPRHRFSSVRPADPPEKKKSQVTKTFVKKSF